MTRERHSYHPFGWKVRRAEVSTRGECREGLTFGVKTRVRDKLRVKPQACQREMVTFRDFPLRILSQTEADSFCLTITFFLLFNVHNHSIKGQNVAAHFQGSVPRSIYILNHCIKHQGHGWPWVAMDALSHGIFFYYFP